MKIETGYFANWRNYQGKELIGIVRIPPKGFRGINLTILAPPEGLYRNYKQGRIDESGFSIEYLNYLSTLDIMNILEPFKESNIVLCCFEKSDKFCHRHLLAKFIKEKYNVVVKEAGGIKQ